MKIILALALILAVAQTLTPRSLFQGNIDSKSVQIDYGQWVTSDAKSISLLIYIEVGSGPNSYAFVSVENEVDTHFNLIQPTSSSADTNIYTESFTIATTGSRKIVLSSPSKLGAYMNTQLYFINQYK